MDMTMQGVMVRGQAQAIGDSADAWKVDAEHWNEEHPAVGSPHIPERLIIDAEEIAWWIEQVLNSAWRRANRASPQDYPWQEVGEIFAGVFAQVLDAFDNLDSDLAKVEGNGLEVVGAGAFRAAHRKVTSVRDRFREGWPMLDEKAAAAASARIAAGQFVALEDLARALDGSL
jgi:hypothetical protein